jgi:two-component sensor histidine kinase
MVYELHLEIKALDSNGMILTYSDSGNWTQDAISDVSFGQELIEVLTEQMNGTLTRTQSTFELFIPELVD